MASAVWEISLFKQLAEVERAIAPWKGRIQRTEEHFNGLSHMLPCRVESFDPYDSYFFCKTLEVQLPAYRWSIDRLKNDIAAIEAEVEKRKGEGKSAIDHEFDLRLYNFQNRLRRTHAVLLLYYDSTVSH